jgi:TolB-like protein
LTTAPHDSAVPPTAPVPAVDPPEDTVPATIWQRIKAHKVLQWILAYAAAAYTLLHVVEMVSTTLDWPHLVGRVVTLMLFLGLPIVATLAWYHGHRAQDRVTGPELAVLTVLLLIAGTVLWMFGRPGREHARETLTTAAPVTAGAAATVTELATRSIAVLAFTDLSEKHDQEYFGDGMATELLDLLAKIPGLTVIGRTSSFQFKGKSEDLRAIGRALGARYVVEGSVRKSGGHVRVGARLIDARDGSQRWSSTYDAESGDVLQLQRTIAVNLARALQLTVSSDFDTRVLTRNPEAYDAYLQGLHALDQFSKDSVEQAAGDFQRALDLDPTFAPAALGLARAYRRMGGEAWLPPRVAFERARHAADLAIQLDPKLGAAHAVHAEILIEHDWDWAAAEKEIELAAQLGGGADEVRAAAELAAVHGQWDQATQLVETGLAADPLNADLLSLLSWGDLRSGRFADAETLMRRALDISPNFGSGHWFLGQALLFQDRLDDALAAMQQESLDDGQLEGTAIVYDAMHRRARSDVALKRATSRNADLWPSAIARAYAFRGDRDRAMNWLERAYLARDEDLYFIRGDPLMRNLEADARYQAFLHKMNFPQ